MTYVQPTAAARGFTIAEHLDRVDRLQRSMRVEQLDAVLVTTPQNVRYITGLVTEFWESPTRPWFVVVPAEGAPIAVIPEIGVAAFANTWITDIRSWPAPVPEDDGVSLLAATLNALPTRWGRVGAELGREMAIRMPVSDLFTVRDLLGGRRLVDASTVLWGARMVKSEAEIDRIRAACAIASDMYDAVPQLISAGMNERLVGRTLRADLLQRGADSVPFLPAVSGAGGIREVISAGGDRTLEDGDVLFVDTGTLFDGYFSDFDRNWAIGHADAASADAYARVWLATERALAAVRPGIRCSELWSVMNEAMSAGTPVTSAVGRFGHGLGLQLTEPPSHRPGDNTVLCEGMVITLEPSMEYGDGRIMAHEENLVVRADGAELLTRRAAPELPVI